MKDSFLSQILPKEESEQKDSFTNFLYGTKKTKSIKESFDDESLADELLFFIKNNHSIRESVQDTKRNLLRHWRKKSYNTDLALKSWLKETMNAAKKYSDHYNRDVRLWEDLFSDDIRQQVAETLEENFRKDIKNNNMEELLDE